MTCNGSGAKPGYAGDRVSAVQGVRGRSMYRPAACSRSSRPAAGVAAAASSSPTRARPAAGSGRVETRESVDRQHPARVSIPGSASPFPGTGTRAHPGAPRATWNSIIRVREHKVFERDGHNLICQFPISFARAALGGPIEITTLTGQTVTAEVPRGAQTHTTVLRLSGHGMPNLDDPRRKGDLLVQLVVETPTSLSPDQEQLLLKLAELEGTTPPTARKGIFGKIKDLISGDPPPTEKK